MSTVLKCNFILSKKLQKIVEQGEPVFLQINAVHGNRGSGWVRFWSNSLPDIEEIGETSIMFTPSEVLEDIPDLTDAAPAQALFQGPGVDQQPPGSPVAKMAMTDPDRAYNNYSSPWAAKTRQDAPRVAARPKVQPTPAVAPEEPLGAPEPPEQGIMTGLEDMPSNRRAAEASPAPQLPQTIQSYEQLMAEIDEMGELDSYKPPKTNGNAAVGRQAAVEMENKGKLAPRVKKPIYIANLRGGRIEISDMEYSIADKEVVDFSQIEAKKLRDSRDFKWCLDNGILGFTDRGEFMHYLENRDSILDSNDRGLKAYSGPPGEAAERAAGEMYDGFDNPLVDEVVSGSAHQRIRQAAEASSRSRRSSQAVIMDEDSDILDLDSHEYDDDADSVAMKNLMGSMDPGGVPQDRGAFDDLPPINYGARSIPRSSRSRTNDGPKSIRKV